MDYNQALEIKRKNIHLIGQMNQRGFIINELIIVPSDPISQKRYMQSFIQTMDCETSILPFKDEDLEVWAIDTEYLRNANILFYERLN